MPIQIVIPADEVKNRGKNPIILEQGQFCSRCNQSPADYFEVHRLHYRVGFKHSHLTGKKYRISTNYQVKLKICETCYQSDFLAHPELLDVNPSNLGRIARFHSLAWTTGALLAGLGFILLTPIIPQIGILSTIKEMWQVPVIMGVLVLFLTWLSQKKYQTKVLHAIEKNNPNFQPIARAEIHTYVLRDEIEASAIALEITLNNESWAEACALQNHWEYKNIKVDDDIKNKG